MKVMGSDPALDMKAFELLQNSHLIWMNKIKEGGNLGTLPGNLFG